jgi:hypothetical protein
MVFLINFFVNAMLKPFLGGNFFLVVEIEWKPSLMDCHNYL